MRSARNFTAKTKKFFPMPLVAGMIVMIGVRIFYSMFTPYDVRSHEWDRHYEVIKIMMRQWSIPSIHDCWECYQQPLYYVGSATWMQLAQWFNVREETGLMVLHYGSLLVSIGILFIIYDVSGLLFRKTRERLLFFMTAASVPGLILLSPISNDPLSALFSFAAIDLLLRWWSKPQSKVFILLCICLGLGLLTKLSMLYMVCAAGTAILLHPKMRTKMKTVRVAWMLIACVLISGWMTVLRFDDQKFSVITNTAGLNPGLRVENSARTLTGFHPVEILRRPYNNPLSRTERSEFLWEYFFRSAYFGEYDFGPLLRPFAFIILLFGMMTIPLMGMGIAAAVVERKSIAIPLAAIAVSAFCMLLIGRILYPFSTTQDFRFVSAILIPLSAFALWGSSALGSKHWNIVASALLWTLTIFCILFSLRMVTG